MINVTSLCVCPPVSNRMCTNFHCTKMSIYENNMYDLPHADVLTKVILNIERNQTYTAIAYRLDI